MDAELPLHYPLQLLHLRQLHDLRQVEAVGGEGLPLPLPLPLAWRLSGHDQLSVLACHSPAKKSKINHWSEEDAI